ncbi:MAG: hypothetical protein OH319_00835 [Candidatus Parvarchaeota archaeon]|nr:hypothetical protein [Candidatus Jingweiarchaeum tengchongense]MCW1297877.1 hypothetical protein [Candidatus Jingweiarchaeum tengchongense]MCW1299888.1 hypothetical protein [Candidatus Jingweiarchaeum tengchongense]MCW1305108.1 hypothetical protein [Candidatus Jingweiarchaeum tengchongense]MCW1305170.1 hypothetical protein [Candidatus Jingweiarchaeum tengchongense]
MAIAEGLGSAWDAASLIVPGGINPVAFYTVFIISFAVLFLLLEQIHLFAKASEPEKARGARLIIALILAYFVASSTLAVTVITKLFPNMGIAILAMLAFLLVVGMISPEGYKKTSVLVLLIALIFVFWSTWTAAVQELGTGISIPVQLTSQDWGIIIAVAIFIFVVYVLMSFGKPSESYGDKFLKLLGLK